MSPPNCSRRQALLWGGGALGLPFPLGCPLIVGAGGCAPYLHYRTALRDRRVVLPAAQLARIANPRDAVVVSITGLAHKLVVRRAGKASQPPGTGGPAAYVALVPQCTHRRCALYVEPGGFSCPCHGSRFDRRGHVTLGPASEPLQRLPARMSNDTLVIEVNT